MTGGGLAVTIRPGGLVSVVIPSDPDVVARRTAALEEYWQERGAAEGKEWALRPHRSATMPGQLERAERLQQDLSLGWRREDDNRILWPMSGERYMRALIAGIEQLRPRLAAMDAELEARPEEFGGRRFDLTLWQSCGPEELTPAESSLVAWIAWVAAPGSETGRAAQLAILEGLTFWTNAARLRFGTWCQYPYFPGFDHE